MVGIGDDSLSIEYGGMKVFGYLHTINACRSDVEELCVCVCVCVCLHVDVCLCVYVCVCMWMHVCV